MRSAYPARRGGRDSRRRTASPGHRSARGPELGSEGPPLGRWVASTRSAPPEPFCADPPHRPTNTTTTQAALPAARDIVRAARWLAKGRGRALLAEPDHYRRRHFAQRAADSGWSVRNLEAEIIRDQARPARAAPHPDPIAAAATLKDMMTRALGIGVRARSRRNGYRLLWGQASRDPLVQLPRSTP